MGYDLQPLVTLEDKKRFLTRACEEHWHIAYEHDPFRAVSLLTRDDRGGIIRGEDVAL